jgi:hypothetical protein
MIETEFAGGGLMRISGAAEASAVSVLIKVLAKANGGNDPGSEQRAGVAGHRHSNAPAR